MGLVLENDTWKLQSDADWYVEYTVDFTTPAMGQPRHGPLRRTTLETQTTP